MSMLFFTTRKGSLILGITYAMWVVISFLAILESSFKAYYFLFFLPFVGYLSYKCLNNFRLSEWNFKEDFVSIHKDLYSVVWVYLTLLIIVFEIKDLLFLK